MGPPQDTPKSLAGRTSEPVGQREVQAAHALLDDRVRRAETALLLGHQLVQISGADESDAIFSQALDELAGAAPGARTPP